MISEKSVIMALKAPAYPLLSRLVSTSSDYSELSFIEFIPNADAVFQLSKDEKMNFHNVPKRICKMFVLKNSNSRRK